MINSRQRAAPALPDFPDYPARMDRRAGADLVTRQLFPVSARSLETWPLLVKYVNGKATIDPAELLALASEKLAAAPTRSGGRKKAPV